MGHLLLPGSLAMVGDRHDLMDVSISQLPLEDREYRIYVGRYNDLRELYIGESRQKADVSPPS